MTNSTFGAYNCADRWSPSIYRFELSLSPTLEWDGENPARETAEALIRELAGAAHEAVHSSIV